MRQFPLTRVVRFLSDRAAPSTARNWGCGWVGVDRHFRPRCALPSRARFTRAQDSRTSSLDPLDLAYVRTDTHHDGIRLERREAVMIEPGWEPPASPLDELRALAVSTSEDESRSLLNRFSDFAAWEREIDSPTVRAAIEYMRGE